MRRRFRCWLVAAAVCALALTAAATTPTQAFADEPEQLVSITFSSFTPDLPTRTDTIRVQGTVTNTSGRPLDRLQILFWRSQEPIVTTDALQQALNYPADQPVGARTSDASICPQGPAFFCFENLYSPTQRMLAPGRSAKFDLQVEVDKHLALPPTQGIYLMGVHVIEDAKNTVGRSRLFVPVLNEAPANTIRVASVVMLNSKPSMVQENLFTDEHLADEVEPGGRLDRLLKAAQRADVSYAIDPALIEELQVMRSGYQVIVGGGKTATGTGQDAAANWLSTFNELEPSQDGFRLPFGSPDIAALSHDGQTGLLARGVKASAKVASVASLPLLVYPAAGVADAGTIAAAESMEPKVILLSDSATGGAGPVLTGIPKTPIVTYTSKAFAGGPGPDPRNTPIHLRQRMLADTWLQAVAAPPGTTLGRVRLITNPAQATGDAGTVGAPWVRQTTLSQLLASKPTSWSGKLSYTEAMRAAELDPGQLAALRELTRSYQAYGELVDGTESAAEAGAQDDASLARTASYLWRGQESGDRGFRLPQEQTLNAALNGEGLKIAANPTLRFSGKKGVFPITVRNDLSVPVTVNIVFASASGQRLRVEPVIGQTIPAKESMSVTVTAEAIAPGPVQVTARLQTTSGVWVGKPVRIDVKATNVGTVGWLIALGAGVVLVGTTVLRVRQVRRESAEVPEMTGPPE